MTKTTLYPSLLDPNAGFLADVSILESAWHQPWSEPVRKAFDNRRDHSISWGVFTPAPEVITEDKWHQPWSDPVRRRPDARMALSFVWNTFTPAGEVITVDKWFLPFITPTIKPNNARFQQTLAYDPFPFSVVIDWFEPLNDPVRLPKGQRAQLHESFYYDPFPIITETITADKWIYPWSEPVRKKPALMTGLQQFNLLQTPIFPNLPRFIQWFKPFNEPVRLKPGLRAWLQQFFVIDTKPPPLPTVTATMAATEVNGDVALFGVSVYSQTPPAGVAIAETDVSITEIQAVKGAAASIKEN